MKSGKISSISVRRWKYFFWNPSFWCVLNSFRSYWLDLIFTTFFSHNLQKFLKEMFSQLWFSIFFLVSCMFCQMTFTISAWKYSVGGFSFRNCIFEEVLFYVYSWLNFRLKIYFQCEDSAIWHLFFNVAFCEFNARSFLCELQPFC